MRLIVARCEVNYIGRVGTALPEAVRLLMIKSDGTFMVWADGGGQSVKPLNWMIPPTAIEYERDPSGTLTGLLVRKSGQDERLAIAIAQVLFESEHELEGQAVLAKEGLERELQELLAAAPRWCGEGFRLVRREWSTDIGPVDMMCRDEADGWVAIEIKRIASIEAVEQLGRYLERIRADPAMQACRGVLVAQQIKPQARVLAHARGIDCVEVELDVLRGEREPALRLFAA